uniref:Uncharacterized protein n=1 Tax=Fundulus heteroclitus TaxID=8078 RepID=A0A3Q2PAU7_FUNHE
MISAALAVALLCLLPLSRSAPLACEDLVRPSDGLTPRHLEGKWALVAGSLSHPPFLERFRQRDSASVNFASSSGDTGASYTRSMRLRGNCTYSSYNITLEGSSFTYDGTDKSNVSAAFVRTSCRDCILMRMDRHSVDLYLLSRRREVEPREMEEFRAQLKCYQLPAPVVTDPTKELCPEHPQSSPTAPKETKVFLQWLK